MADYSAVPCACRGTKGMLYLAPSEPIARLYDGLAVSWIGQFPGNISTGIVPGPQITIELPGIPPKPVWGPDGITPCGMLDFNLGGLCSAVYVAAIDGWIQTSPTDTGTQARFQHGQCRFVSGGTNTVILHGYNGYGLWVRDPVKKAFVKRNVGGGLSQRIDNNTAWIDGVPGQSLASDTLYYAYAVIYGTGLRLDLSTTGHGTDPNLGIEVKATDSNCTYVGMLYTLNGVVGPFTGTNGLCLVSSWFNRQAIQTQLSYSATGVTQTSPGSLSADKLCIVTHADNTPMIHASGYGVGRAFMKLRADMVAGPCVAAGTQYGSISGGNGDPFALHSVWGQPIPEGYIEIYPEGWVDSGSTDFHLTVNAQVFL